MSRSTMLAALAALALLAAALGSGVAAAGEFQFNPGGTITGTSLGPVTFSSNGITITCNLTLRGTVTSSRVPKVAGTSYGAITAVSIGRCSGGTAAVLGLPWPVTYDAILGTLPEGVTGVQLTIERTGFALNTLGLECLYGGTLTSLLAVTGRNPYTTGLYAIPSGSSVPLVRGGILCPTTGTMTGTFGISPTQTVTRI
ncbi:MAG TPA: hypothetical protein VFU94_01715 [Conexibacter sp.]|nr:hypothetical protein [Conexibacter sp.]